MTAEIKIIIADDHPIFRRGLRQVIESVPTLKVIGEAGDGAAAIAQIRELKPDLAVIDLDMPGKDGFEITRTICDQSLAVEVIFLTMHNSEALFNRALDVGVKGYVLKDNAVSDILDAIRAVAAGKSYISPQVSGYLVQRHSRTQALANEKPGLDSLTPTERRVLKLIADEKTSRDIATRLFISVRTVEHHRANICLKLNLRGSNALIKFAIAHRSELTSVQK
jgi:two-component system, NarL family, response regulator DegU